MSLIRASSLPEEKHCDRQIKLQADVGSAASGPDGGPDSARDGLPSHALNRAGIQTQARVKSASERKMALWKRILQRSAVIGGKVELREPTWRGRALITWTTLARSKFVRWLACSIDRCRTSHKKRSAARRDSQTGRLQSDR
ncbi:unnamed protein product [Protopolystoma xenopodis]|uniref:Uncharacterized protein n=1 Tax=Protopolystoma xenopodis TaxID=117903 RepID=A0A3S4ZF74_9PLAT|nr:unnamed protein product [Protopolystoma xenopodis]